MSQRDAGNYPLVIRMSPDLRAAVKAKAEAEQRSMAQVMRLALRAYCGETPAPAEVVPPSVLAAEGWL